MMTKIVWRHNNKWHRRYRLTVSRARKFAKRLTGDVIFISNAALYEFVK